MRLDRLLSVTVLCVEAKTFSETSLHGSISGRSHALLRFCFVLIRVSGDSQTNVQMGDSNWQIAGLEYGMEWWNGKWNGRVNVHSCV